jgi:hypothetical protein
MDFAFNRSGDLADVATHVSRVISEGLLTFDLQTLLARYCARHGEVFDSLSGPRFAFHSTWSTFMQ